MILSPFTLAVSCNLVQRLPPHHYRRLNDRTFHKALPRHILVCDQAVHPFYIPLHTLANRTKDRHPPTYDRKTGMTDEECLLPGEARWVGNIIRIHSCDQGRPRRSYCLGSRLGDTPVLSLKDPDPGIVEAPSNLAGCISASIEHHNQLKRGPRLTEAALDRLRDRSSSIEHRHHNRNCRRTHPGKDSSIPRAWTRPWASTTMTMGRQHTSQS